MQVQYSRQDEYDLRNVAEKAQVWGGTAVLSKAGAPHLVGTWCPSCFIHLYGNVLDACTEHVRPPACVLLMPCYINMLAYIIRL